LSNQQHSTQNKMRALKVSLLLVLALCLAGNEAAKRRRMRSKAKISMGACKRRCNSGKMGKGACRQSDAVCENASIVFVVDSSSSVGPRNFTTVKKFMTDIVKKFEVKPGDRGVRVALHQYSSYHKQKKEFGLDAHDTTDGVVGAINQIQWLTGDTHTARALTQVRDNIIRPAHRANPDRASIIIVITDGDPQDYKKVPAAVESLKEFGTKIFAIGVGDATRPELDKLAWVGDKSNDKAVFYADRYDGALAFQNEIVQTICKNN